MWGNKVYTHVFVLTEQLWSNNETKPLLLGSGTWCLWGDLFSIVYPFEFCLKHALLHFKKSLFKCTWDSILKHPQITLQEHFHNPELMEQYRKHSRNKNTVTAEDTFHELPGSKHTHNRQTACITWIKFKLSKN